MFIVQNKNKHYDFVVDEKDVTKLIKVIYDKLEIIDFKIGNCGWIKYPEKWFIMFKTKKDAYKVLCKIGTIEMKENERLYFNFK